jgi:hypothetical protein
MMTAPVTRIIKSVVSQRGMCFAGFVMARPFRNCIMQRVKAGRCDLVHETGKKWQLGRLLAFHKFGAIVALSLLP